MSFDPLVLQSSPELTGNSLLVGLVVDNNDPTKRQGIRVTIPSLLESKELDELPWLAPLVSSPYGVGDDYGVVHVPRLGSRVLCRFQSGDLQYGVYEGSVLANGFTPPTEFIENYPNRVGMFLPTGDILYVDMTTKDLVFRRTSGTAILIDEAGNVTLSVAGNLTEYVKGNVNRVVEGNVTETVSGSYTTSVSGSRNTTISGSDSRTVSGSDAHNISGKRVVSCSSEDHSGDIKNSGDVIALGISLSSHAHTGVRGGPDTSGPPT